MKTTAMTGVFAAALAVLTLTATAENYRPGPPPGQGHPGGPGGERGPRGGGMEEAVISKLIQHPELAEKLGLTDAQLETLREGMFDLRQEKARKRAEIEVAAIEQARLLTAGDVDERALMKAVDETGRVRTEMAKLEMRGLLLLRKTLTEEQRDKIQMFMRQRGRENRRGDQARQGRRNESEGRDGARQAGRREGRPEASAEREND